MSRKLYYIRSNVINCKSVIFITIWEYAKSQKYSAIKYNGIFYTLF